ncbi:Nitronate monooxygenase [Aerococcus viridans]|uniref:nitronate monooxygenase n=1 Tax=Aerococcus viridans TaxID=1377 RepID=UPI000E125218|nr:nitronate monooxygenase [Aerococcus viridans]SUU74724.1 Nitronate monooxygenase [Aerococcus viridans]
MFLGPVLWAKAVEKISVPVLAAGGIVDSKSLYAAMALGVDGVLMSTRFLATPEVNASDTYRQALLQIPENGTV